MPEAEVLYSDVVFKRTKGNTTGSQQVESNKRSKVKSEKVALVILSVLLAVVVIAFCFVFYDDIVTKKKLQTLEAEHEAKEIPFCPQPPEIKTNDSCPKCDKNWEQHRGTCYFFSTTKSSWEESRHFCQSKGGDLLKIDSRAEQIFLQKKLSDKMMLPEDKFWIGLTDSQEENKWFWVDGSPLNTSLSFWREDEPDNWKEENPEGEDCVRMGEKVAENLKCWFDKSCDKPHKYICEKQAKDGVRRFTCF